MSVGDVVLRVLVKLSPGLSGCYMCVLRKQRYVAGASLAEEDPVFLLHRLCLCGAPYW